MVVPQAKQLGAIRGVSWVGLAMCVPYAALIVQCQRWAHDPHVNDKSRLVWEQLPVLPQMGLAGSVGLEPLFAWLPQLITDVWFATQALVVFYLFGWALEAFF